MSYTLTGDSQLSGNCIKDRIAYIGCVCKVNSSISLGLMEGGECNDKD